ncbi:hypothetical protein D039_0394B, partial [Vibrio parahaemolyticus EKP-028]
TAQQKARCPTIRSPSTNLRTDQCQPKVARTTQNEAWHESPLFSPNDR